MSDLRSHGDTETVQSDHDKKVEAVLTAWRNRFPNNMFAWPGAPESFASEAVRVLSEEKVKDERKRLSRWGVGS